MRMSWRMRKVIGLLNLSALILCVCLLAYPTEGECQINTPSQLSQTICPSHGPGECGCLVAETEGHGANQVYLIKMKKYILQLPGRTTYLPIAVVADNANFLSIQNRSSDIVERLGMAFDLLGLALVS